MDISTNFLGSIPGFSGCMEGIPRAASSHTALRKTERKVVPVPGRVDEDSDHHKWLMKPKLPS